jgi:hypothetical protein
VSVRRHNCSRQFADVMACHDVREEAVQRSRVMLFNEDWHVLSGVKIDVVDVCHREPVFLSPIE